MENSASEDSGIFGSKGSQHEASLILLSVPWDVTTSYGDGTSFAPQGIIKASHQLDLEDPYFSCPFAAGIWMEAPDPELIDLNQKGKNFAQDSRNSQNKESIHAVNELSQKLNAKIAKKAHSYLTQGKLVGMVGGEHSSPYGLIAALSERKEFGILHIDAHFDLRIAYEGFTHSHASIMYNIRRDFANILDIVHVGIRDFCKSELEFAKGHKLHHLYSDNDIFLHLAHGYTYAAICSKICAKLPENVYISCDIDGLNPTYCPGTGTPVPGGLDFNQLAFLLYTLVKQKKKIIGFDLCEVSSGQNKSEWDFNVGARVLYRLCGAFLASQNMIYEKE